jgi:hypothetical protein
MIRFPREIRTVKDRDEYLTEDNAADTIGLSCYALCALRGSIGFRWDSENKNTPLYHRDDLQRFINQPEYPVCQKLEIFTTHKLTPSEEDRMEDLWLVEKVKQLCDQFCEGDTDGFDRTSDEINARNRERRS